LRKKEAAVSIEMTEVGGHKDQLIEALGECQAGRCSCPTNEFDNLAAMDIEQASDVIRIRLEPKAGERIDTAEIAACLDCTTAKVAGAEHNA
jgi:hypothetical protein